MWKDSGAYSCATVFLTTTVHVQVGGEFLPEGKMGETVTPAVFLPLNVHRASELFEAPPAVFQRGFHIRRGVFEWRAKNRP